MEISKESKDSDINRVIDILKSRANTLLKNIPKEFRQDRDIELLLKKTEEELESHIRVLRGLINDTELLYFALDMTLVATRCWESWKMNENDVFVFQQFDRNFYQREIGHSWQHLQSCTQVNDICHSNENEKLKTIMNKAYDSLRANLAIVKLICPEVKTVDHLNEFLLSQEIYSFRSSFLNVYGFSSFDGSRLYINLTQLDSISEEFWQKLIEHESMHNISRYFDKRPNNNLGYGKISPTKNALLKEKNGKMIEAGQFYYMKKMKLEDPENPSPFCLFEVDVMKYY